MQSRRRKWRIIENESRKREKELWVGSRIFEDCSSFDCFNIASYNASGVKADVNITSSKSFLSVAAQLALIIVAGLIVFKTVNDVGFVLFTFHPSFMAIGVSFKVL